MGELSRNRMIAIRHLSGETHTSIARSVGLSTTRVSQIFVRELFDVLRGSPLGARYLAHRRIIEGEFAPREKSHITQWRGWAVACKFAKAEYLDNELALAAIGVRTYHATQAIGLKTLRDLCEADPDKVLRAPNIGRRTFNELVEVMAYPERYWQTAQ